MKSRHASAAATSTAPPVTARLVRARLQRLAGPHERLGRDAAPVGALAAEQLALDDRDSQAAVGEPGGAVLAGGPAAERR